MVQNYGIRVHFVIGENYGMSGHFVMGHLDEMSVHFVMVLKSFVAKVIQFSS